MTELIAILVLVYISFHAVGIIILAEFDFIYHPGDIYYNSDSLNWFGAIFLWLLWVIFCPVWAFVGFMIWVCTVGRR